MDKQTVLVETWFHILIFDDLPGAVKLARIRVLGRGFDFRHGPIYNFITSYLA